jgi:ABC-type multidrug transport system permease subunit
MLKREHFNRWYSTGAYVLALNMVDIPAMILNNIVFVSITYFMTNQPMEIMRFSMFFLISVLVGFTSQGLGLLSSSMANIQYTLIIAAGGIFIFTMFSGFFVLMKDTSYGWHWLFYSSFLKHGLDGGFHAILGFNRTKLECEADYCHYRWPKKFLETLGIESANFAEAVGVIVFSLLLFRVLLYFVIKYRLKH